MKRMSLFVRLFVSIKKKKEKKNNYNNKKKINLFKKKKEKFNRLFAVSFLE